jgi:hypothetical protein
LRAGEDGAISARLLPLARTPLGVALGDSRQDVSIPLDGLFEWLDRTFPADDEQAFIASPRDLELLARLAWHSSFPEPLDEESILNADDLPEELADALARPLSTLVQCDTCRRLCVRDNFTWKEKQLCAWDFHAQLFGRRGPWREGPYEARHFETLPVCAYVAPELLGDVGVDVALSVGALAQSAERAVVNALLESDPGRPHMAVKTPAGVVVLREA